MEIKFSENLINTSTFLKTIYLNESSVQNMKGIKEIRLIKFQ